MSAFILLPLRAELALGHVLKNPAGCAVAGQDRSAHPVLHPMANEVMKRANQALLVLVLSSLITVLGTALAVAQNTDGLRYFRSFVPIEVITATANEVCEPHLGSIENSFRLVCDRDGSCNAEDTTSLEYDDNDIFLTPQFDMLFSESLKRAPESSWTDTIQVKPEFWEKPISVKIISRTRGPDIKRAAQISDCFRKVGKLLIDTVRPYETESIVSESADTKQGSHVEHYNLEELDHSILEVRYPSTKRAGIGFPIEIKLIMSQKLGVRKFIPEKPEKARARLTSLILSGLHTKPLFGLKSKLEEKLGPLPGLGEYNNSNINGIKLVPRDPSFELIAIKVTGDSASVVPLTTELQNVTPLRPSSWSWSVTEKDGGEKRFYISVSASNKRTFTRVIPITLEVADNYLGSLRSFLAQNWQWIAGTIVIPLTLFLWSKRRRVHEFGGGQQ
jgi:hypothetical protein